MYWIHPKHTPSQMQYTMKDAESSSEKSAGICWVVDVQSDPVAQEPAKTKRNQASHAQTAPVKAMRFGPVLEMQM